MFRSTSVAKELFKRPGWHSNVNRLIEYVIIKVINDSMYNHWEDEELIDSLLLLLVNTMSQLQKGETQFESSTTVVQTEKQECSESVPDLVSALIKKVLIDNKSTEIRISLALKTIASIVNTAPKVGFPHTRRRTQYMKSLAAVRLFDIICSRIHSTDKKLSGKMSDENVILSWHVLALLGECNECMPDSRRKKSKDCNPIVENSNSSFSKIVKMILKRYITCRQFESGHRSTPEGVSDVSSDTFDLLDELMTDNGRKEAINGRLASQVCEYICYERIFDTAFRALAELAACSSSMKELLSTLLSTEFDFVSQDTIEDSMASSEKTPLNLELLIEMLLLHNQLKPSCYKVCCQVTVDLHFLSVLCVSRRIRDICITLHKGNYLMANIVENMLVIAHKDFTLRAEGRNIDSMTSVSNMDASGHISVIRACLKCLNWLYIDDHHFLFQNGSCKTGTEVCHKELLLVLTKIAEMVPSKLDNEIIDDNLRLLALMILSFYGSYGIKSRIGKRLARFRKNFYDDIMQDDVYTQYEIDQFSDIAFIVKDDLSEDMLLPAHRDIINATCEHLLRCDNNSNILRDDENRVIIRMASTLNHKIFKSFLDFLYTGLCVLPRDSSRQTQHEMHTQMLLLSTKCGQHFLRALVKRSKIPIAARHYLSECVPIKPVNGCDSGLSKTPHNCISLRTQSGFTAVFHKVVLFSVSEYFRTFLSLKKSSQLGSDCTDTHESFFCDSNSEQSDVGDVSELSLTCFQNFCYGLPILYQPCPVSNDSADMSVEPYDHTDYQEISQDLLYIADSKLIEDEELFEIAYDLSINAVKYMSK